MENLKLKCCIFAGQSVSKANDRLANGSKLIETLMDIFGQFVASRPTNAMTAVACSPGKILFARDDIMPGMILFSMYVIFHYG